ncbi:hypothetical protein [Kitasatospora cineracea]|uniref:Uncharacterized protein n=1 Tax=Kitasatospora cineracea TaxID=88074 RepID=A0A8G1XBF4_9ACTN|nr:hypothetical protein [Kitasatospora cineracea]ROR43639.1 hypothetical protein EDD39_1805 [Kitasatospora cineracea]
MDVARPAEAAAVSALAGLLPVPDAAPADPLDGGSPAPAGGNNSATRGG